MFFLYQRINPSLYSWLTGGVSADSFLLYIGPSGLKQLPRINCCNHKRELLSFRECAIPTIPVLSDPFFSFTVLHQPLTVCLGYACALLRVHLGLVSNVVIPHAWNRKGISAICLIKRSALVVRQGLGRKCCGNTVGSRALSPWSGPQEEFSCRAQNVC